MVCECKWYVMRNGRVVGERNGCMVVFIRGGSFDDGTLIQMDMNPG